jgi:hypothetical protein
MCLRYPASFPAARIRNFHASHVVRVVQSRNVLHTLRKDLKLCRTDGALDHFLCVTQAFRPGLAYAAPTALVS